MKLSLPSRIILAIVFLVISLNQGNAIDTYFKVENNFLKLGNSSLEFQFKGNDGGLYSFLDKKNNVDFITEKSAWWNLYSFYYQVNDAQVYVGGWLAKSFTFDTIQTSNSIILNLYWDGFQTEISLDMKVQVSIEIIDGSPFASWHIKIDNNTNKTIEGVNFPSLSGLGKISSNSSNDFVVLPCMGGLLFQNPLANFTLNTGGWGYEQNYPAAFGNMQFTAYYSDEKNTGLYISSEDSNGNKKFFSWGKPDPSWLSFAINNTPVFTEGNDIDLPYKLKIGIFSGDWYDAAKIYRNWAITQPWTAKGKIYERPDIPLWFKKLPLNTWILTHSWEYTPGIPFSSVVERSTNISSFLKLPVSMNWIGWENQGWYIRHPDIFPPKEGFDSFDKTIDGLHKNLNNFTSIINSTSFSSLAPTMSQASTSFIINKNGDFSLNGLYSEGSFNTTFYKMCPETDYWKNRINEITNTLTAHKVDVVEMDGFPLTVPICYDQNHGHPIGGGNWWANEYYKLFENSRLEARLINPNVAFQTEGMSEYFIPIFDSFWNMFTTGFSLYEGRAIDATKTKFVPLFHTVYHDYILLQSGISFYNNKPGEEDYYRRGFGLALTLGETPTTFDGNAEIESATDTNMVEYLKQVVQARYSYATEFLVYGEMLKPPRINVPDFLIPGVSTIPYTMVEHPAFYSPTVLASCWKSPQDAIGYVLTNISNQEVTFNLEISKHDLTGLNYDVYKILNGNYSVSYKNTTLPKTETITLKPSDVLLLKAYPALSGTNDLSISDEDIEIERDTLAMGEAINVKATIHNNGNSDIYGITVCLYVKNPLEGGKPVSLNQTVPLIKAGKSETAEIIFRSEGLFKEQDIYVKVDPENLINETNENNNIAHKALFIKAPSILFDESHDEINTLSWDRALSINTNHPEWYYFGQFRKRTGKEYYIERLVNGPITSDSLKNFRILILSVPRKAFDESEIKNILDFVENGGRLLVLGDAGIPNYANNLTEKFGVTYNGGAVVSQTNVADPGSFWITKFPSHDINTDISNIFVNWSSPMDIKPPASAFCYTDSTTWIDTNNNGIADINEKVGPLVYGAISLLGKGAAVFLSDNAFHEGVFETNKTLMLNILDWLNKYNNTPTGTNSNSFNLDFETTFSLDQNYPNPFYSSTTIPFHIPYSSKVTISIYNILGQRVITLLDEKMGQGKYTIKWNGLNYDGQQAGNGLYFIEMKAGEFHNIRKAILLK